MNPICKKSLAVATLALACCGAMAGTVDASGDYLATFTGAQNADLDVISANVLFNPNSHIFSLTGTMGGNIGTTPNAVYVWGVNRGLGTAGFASIGATGVLFDMVIAINGATGAVTITDRAPNPIATFNLAAGSAHFDGATVSLDLDESWLPGRGFTVDQYTWNLWPRDSRVAGTAAISDFAPNNSNFATTVPEPASALLALLGLGLAAGARRRQAQ